MTLDELCSKLIPQKVETSGEITLFLVILILALNNFWYFLGKSFTIILWVYLFLNAGIVNVFNLSSSSDNPNCPKCKKRLKVREEYSCTKCGDINFGVKR